MLEECSPDGACCLCFYSLRLNTAALYTKHGKLENKNNYVFTKCHVICWNVWVDWWAVCGGSGGEHACLRNPAPEHHMGHRHRPRCEGRALLSQKVGLSRAAYPALCVCASSASFFLHRNLSECRKGFILMAMFLLGFLWLCSPQGGRDTRQSISWTSPVLSCSFGF